MADHGISPGQIDQLARVLAPFADQIDRVALFGSRASGTARAQSDIDLVIYGPIAEATLDRLWTLFDASALPVTVDVVAYDRVATPALKSHIDAVSLTLFTREDLCRRAAWHGRAHV